MLKEIERYRCIRGDCLHRVRQLPDGSVDAFVTDPPYGIELRLGTRKRGHRSIAGDGRLEARRLWQAVIPEMARVARRDSLHLVFGTWKSSWMVDVLSQSFAVKGCIAWDKRVIGLGHFLRPRWEMIYLVAKGSPARHVLPAPGDLWPFPRLRRTRHPCEKPVPLLRACVRLVSVPGELVADPFAGVFSTGEAAMAEGRRFMGIEKDVRHFRLGEARLAAVARAIDDGTYAGRTA